MPNSSGSIPEGHSSLFHHLSTEKNWTRSKNAQTRLIKCDIFRVCILFKGNRPYRKGYSYQMLLSSIIQIYICKDSPLVSFPQLMISLVESKQCSFSSHIDFCLSLMLGNISSCACIPMRFTLATHMPGHFGAFYDLLRLHSFLA